MSRFVRYVLRTTDVDGARAFYAAVLGGERNHEMFPLHEEALARGARAHWLGMVGVDDARGAAAAFVERGATQLGPISETARGTFTVLRDPGGAVVALLQGPGAPPDDIVWHLMNSNDVDRTLAAYVDILGWTRGAQRDLGEHGMFHEFAWEGSAAAGSFVSIAGRAGRHPHWLFHFRVPALDAAVEKVRAANGLVLGPFKVPDGPRVAVCDDPQGAAFALIEMP